MLKLRKSDCQLIFNMLDSDFFLKPRLNLINLFFDKLVDYLN